MNIVSIRQKICKGVTFRFAEVQGTPADHASAWSFEDEQEVRDRHWHPKPGETVLDIGAAFGSYALPALAAGARVICFSPADFDTELLQINLGLNPELSARCLVVRDGIHEADGWFDPDHSKFQLDGNMTTVLGEGQWLRVRSLDSFLADRPGIERVNWIKMDIEGAELDALRGAEKCLRMERPKLLIENHNFHRATMESDVLGFLVGLGVGYACDGPYPHGAVSHSFFEAK